MYINIPSKNFKYENDTQISYIQKQNWNNSLYFYNSYIKKRFRLKINKTTKNDNTTTTTKKNK